MKHSFWYRLTDWIFTIADDIDQTTNSSAFVFFYGLGRSFCLWVVWWICFYNDIHYAPLSYVSLYLVILFIVGAVALCRYCFTKSDQIVGIGFVVLALVSIEVVLMQLIKTTAQRIGKKRNRYEVASL